MPRRRMIGPDFWNDHYIATLTHDERLFLLGCLGNADDEGRLIGHAAYLKAAMFMYDENFTTAQVQEIKQGCLDKMASWPTTHPYHLIPYQNANEEYLFFPNWYEHQKPSHPAKSKLPTPPLETLPIFSPQTPEPLPSVSGGTPEAFAPRSGQSSQGKVRSGQVSAVQEDFTKSLDSDTDLTDMLTKTMTKNISAGRAALLASQADPVLSPEIEAKVKATWGIQVLKKCWGDGVGGDMPQAIFEGALKALNQYPLEIVAKAFAKGVRYKGGKHKSWKYIQTIIDEEMDKRGGARTRAP